MLFKCMSSKLTFFSGYKTKSIQKIKLGILPKYLKGIRISIGLLFNLYQGKEPLFFSFEFIYFFSQAFGLSPSLSSGVNNYHNCTVLIIHEKRHR